MYESVSAPELGAVGAGLRKNQLAANNKTTMTFPRPCQSPILFALVLEGIAHQSMNPKTAANKPPRIPAAIIRNETPNQELSLVDKATRSNTTAVASSPSGKTISIGCIGCPSNFALLSIVPPEIALISCGGLVRELCST
jgi:hypothetical protein